MEQRFAFNEVAEAYRAARPDYPEVLIEDVIAYAGLRSDDRILEVGCGTGQATKGFARRGYAILATDPGGEMLRGARESLAEFDNVEFMETTFEVFPDMPSRFRLVIAAQSWHWVAPAVRFVKAARVLARDGTLAVFGHVPVGLPEGVRQRFQDIYLRHIGRWGAAPEAGYLPSGPFKGWFEESGLFQGVEHRRYAWVWQHTTASYLHLLSTRSDHRMLPADKREELLADVAGAIDAEGGRLDVDYETHLYMARLKERE